MPGTRLRELLAAIRNGAGEFPFDCAYADGLILLARAEGRAGADVVADARAWGNQRVRRAAAEATGIVAGTQDAFAVVMERNEREGAEGLSGPQLDFLTPNWLDAEVRDGGFGQYFFNSSGELAGHAVGAAEAVGATEAARIIRRAVALFGRGGPDCDRVERRTQPIAIRPATQKTLDTEYHDCPDDLRELLPLYVARHPNKFRRKVDAAGGRAEPGAAPAIRSVSRCSSRASAARGLRPGR